MIRIHLTAVLMSVSGVSLAAQSPHSDTLSTVSVTVPRSVFDIEHAPFSTAIVSPGDATLARTGMSLDAALNGVPGVQADNRLNFALGDRIAIRGLGARSQFGVRGVRVIVDGIPATLADGQTTLSNLDLASLGTIRVLRGAASALYGNASAGVILLETEEPSIEGFTPVVGGLTGSDGLRRYHVGALGRANRWRYVLSANRLDYGGYRAYSTARNAHANAVIAYEDSRASVKLVFNGEQHSAENPGALSDSLLRADRRQAFADNVLQRTGESGAQNQAGMSTRIRLPLGEFRVAGYGLARRLDNPIPPRIIAVHRGASGVRAEYGARFMASSVTISTLFGGEAAWQRDDRQNWTNVRGARGAITLNQLERVRSLAPFAQVSSGAGPFTLFAGVRRDRVRFSADDRLIGGTNPDDSGVRTMAANSYSTGITYTIVPQIEWYVNTGTAFQTPTTTELANRSDGAGGFNPTLQPERTRATESGVRGRLPAGVGYQLAAYRMRVSGELIPFEVPAVPGRQFYRNAGSALHKGTDVGVSIPLAGWGTVRAGYAYVDARVRSDTASSSRQRRVPGVVPHLATLAVNVGAAESRFAALEFRAQSSTPVNDANTAHSAGYLVTNLRGSISPLAHWRLSGGIGNLFDIRYATSVVINAAGGRYFEPAAGRTVFVGAEFR